MKRFGCVLLALSWVPLACGSNDDSSSSNGGTGGGLSYDAAGDSPQVETGPSCGPTELCERSINECAANLTQSQCEGWYATASNCANMAAYTSCNCDCISEATCNDYFSCGQICFDTHC